MRCWRRVEKISWSDIVRNEEILHSVKEERNIVHTIQRGKADWIGRILRWKCLIKHTVERKIEGGIEVRGRQGRGRKQLLDDLFERVGYCELKEKALDRAVWRIRFGRGLNLSQDGLRNEWTCMKRRLFSGFAWTWDDCRVCSSLFFFLKPA